MEKITSLLFWEKKASEANKGKISGLMASMLFPDKEIAQYRDLIEKRHLFKKVKVKNTDFVLDLGCGSGRWATSFAKKCNRVVAVDFSKSFIELAKKNAKEKGIENIKFLRRDISDITVIKKEKYDIVHNGGVFQYVNDKKLDHLLDNLILSLKNGGYFISRDSVNLINRLEKKGKYPVIYRSEKEIIKNFTSKGLVFIDSFENLPPNYFYKIYQSFPSFFKKNYIEKIMLKASYYLDDILRITFPIYYFFGEKWLKKKGKFNPEKFYTRHKFYIFCKSK